MTVFNVVMWLMAVFALTFASSCSEPAEESPRDAAFRFMTVTTTGQVEVSFWRSDGAPVTPAAANERPTSQRNQEFALSTKESVIARFEVSRAGTVTITVQVWDKGDAFLGPVAEVTKDARFVLDEASGAVATVTYSRDSNFHDLRLQIDRDGDGQIDSEQAPDTVEQ